MVGLHRLNGNVYAVTALFHLSKVGVNAGFVTTKNSIIHIDAGMTVTDGNYLLAQSRKKAKNKENLPYSNSPSLRPYVRHASIQRSRRKNNRPQKCSQFPLLQNTPIISHSSQNIQTFHRQTHG